MPKLTKTNKSSVNPQKKVTQITCAACGENKKVSEYYVSYNPIHQTGRISYCKVCLKKMICDESGNVQLDKLKETLKLIDKPFIYNLWKTSLEEPGDSFGNFIKNLAMTQYRKLGYADSRFLPEVDTKLNYDTSNPESYEFKIDFQVTEEIIDKWGYGYKIEEYQAFEKKYSFVSEDNILLK